MYFTYVYIYFLHDNKHTYNSLEFKYLYTSLHPELPGLSACRLSGCGQWTAWIRLQRRLPLGGQVQYWS